MKRVFDVVVSLGGLISLLPLMILIAIVVRTTSQGPVLFGQTRIGLGFRPFTMYKFRTMLADAAAIGPSITVGADPRITWCGRYLRAAKLDELPQLWNVFIGDMSFVGPRPELPEYVEMFREHFSAILRVRPGITDPASIEFRDEASVLGKARDPHDEYVSRILPRKLRLANEYCQRQSVLKDVILIVRTLQSLFHFN